MAGPDGTDGDTALQIAIEDVGDDRDPSTLRNIDPDRTGPDAPADPPPDIPDDPDSEGLMDIEIRSGNVPRRGDQVSLQRPRDRPGRYCRRSPPEQQQSMKPPLITRIETFEFTVNLRNISGSSSGLGLIYTPGDQGTVGRSAMRIETDAGVSGEAAGQMIMAVRQADLVARFLIGRDARQRNEIYRDLLFELRQHDALAIGLIDICLWDLAGKLYDAPVYELLGGRRRPLRAYASTYHGDRVGGLDSAQAYADFAVRCQQMGYTAFKIHGWIDADPGEEIATIHAVRDAVGDSMALMSDPACAIATFVEAVRVGRACDEAGFAWYEDPLWEGGKSFHVHRMLREKLQTPLLMSEYLRGLMAHTDAAIAGATDILRVDAYQDGGITGAMKIAHVAEGLGLDVEIHSHSPAHRHLMTALRNTNFYEMNLVHPDPKADTSAVNTYTNYRDGLDAIDDQGCVYAPEGPGLGAQVDWDYIHAHRTGGAVYER